MKNRSTFWERRYLKAGEMIKVHQREMEGGGDGGDGEDEEDGVVETPPVERLGDGEAGEVNSPNRIAYCLFPNT